MTTIHTAHGVGEVVATVTERGGRISYKVKIGLDERWVKDHEVLGSAEGGPENLFSYQFGPGVPDTRAMMYGNENPEKDFVVGNVFAMGSKAFTHEPASKVNKNNTTTLPYDPTPQTPTDMFPDQTIQPGEYGIDPKKRTRPSDSLTFNTRSPDSGPGPSPNLFATGAYSALQERSEIVAGPRYPHPGDEQSAWDNHDPADYYSGIPDHASETDDSPHHPGHWGSRDSDYLLYEGLFAEAEELTDEQRGKRREDYPRQSRDPAADRPRLRPSDQPLYPFDKVSPSGHTTHEMGEKDDPDWYSCPDCGAWHNPFRHMKNRRGPKPPRSDDAFQPAYKGAMRCITCAGPDEHGLGYHEHEGEYEDWTPPWERHAEGRHRAPPNEDPFIDTLDRGALPELVKDPGNEDQVFMKRTPYPKPRGEHFAPSFMDKLRGRAAGIEYPADMPDKFAYIPGPEDFTNPTQNALAAIQRQAAILEGEYGLSPRVATEMDLVEHDAHIREAAWRDVQRKAKRLRTEGRVHIKESSPEHIVATVDGDTGTYDTIIVRGNVFDLGGQSVTSWHCGCDWGRWAFKRRLTYVGRFCSHAYATYQEMRSAHDLPGGTRSRTRSAGVVEDYKKWAEENDQPIGLDSVANFVTLPQDDDEEAPLTDDEVAKLYDYAEGNLPESPERQYDIDYTFDNDKAYKQGREMLRTKPRSLTPDLQFVPDGEPEHLVDVTKDDRKTTGPGQIMHGGRHEFESPEAEEAARSQYEQRGARPVAPGSDAYLHAPRPPGPPIPGWVGQSVERIHPPGRHRATADEDGGQEPGDGEIVHFTTASEEQKVNNPTPGSPANPRPDAGEATRDLNKLRNLIQQPLSDSFGHMDDRNDKVRDLVDDLHDGGVAADNLVASRQFEAEGDFMSPGGGTWADLPFAGSGPDPKDWYGSSADYIDDHERPNFQDVTDLSDDGDILKYNDSDSPVTSPKEAYYRQAAPDEANPPSDSERARFADPADVHYADLFSNETSSMGPMGMNIGPTDAGDVNGATPLVNPGDNVSGAEQDPTGTLASLLFFADGDTMEDPGGNTMEDPGMSGTGSDAMGGLGGGGFPGSPTNSNPAATMPMPPVGGGGMAPMGGGAPGDMAPMGGGAMGDMAHMKDPSTTFASHRPSIRDSIAQRNQHWQQRHAYDPSGLPPGWGDVPSNPDDDEDPLPSLPGQKQVMDLLPNQMPKIPGMGGGKGGPGGGGAAAEGGLAEELPLVAASVDPRWDHSDVVAQFQRSAGAAALRGRGGGGGPAMDPRSQAMGQWGAQGGGRTAGRGHFSDGDIAGAAANFLHRTAGRTYSPAEQAGLMNEEPVNGRGARNLGGLDLRNTHYEARD